MSDIKIVWDASSSTATLPRSKGDFTEDDGLSTAIILSLLTWGRAGDEDLPSSEDKKGWWGDSYADVDSDQIGSKIWLLFREKVTDETILRLKEYATQSLNWLIEDKVASRVDVAAERNAADHERIDLGVTVYRGDEKAVELRFDNIWKIIRG